MGFSYGSFHCFSRYTERGGGNVYVHRIQSVRKTGGHCFHSNHGDWYAAAVIEKEIFVVFLDFNFYSVFVRIVIFTNIEYTLNEN